MKKLLILSLLVASCHCPDNEGQNEIIPECVQHIIKNDNQHNTLKAVGTMHTGNDIHYWLKTDAMHFDGIEYIVNNTCDTICYYCGECVFPECTSIYQGEWKLIWTK